MFQRLVTDKQLAYKKVYAILNSINVKERPGLKKWKVIIRSKGVNI